jgi:hypothetical protein
VTKEQIEKDIGIPITCAIHNRQEINTSRAEQELIAIPPIIQGWLLGFELLKKSSVPYEYVLILRPDLFFENTKKSNSFLRPKQFKKYKNSIGIRPSSTTDLSDDLFFSTYNNLDTFFSGLIEYWRLNSVTHQYHWHTMLYYYIVQNLNLIHINPPFTSDYVIARYPITPTTTFGDAWEQWWEWFNQNN